MSENAIQQLLDEIADVLQMGVTLDDLGGHLVAYSTRHGHADEARIRALLEREVPAEVRAWESHHGLPTTVPVELPANPELGMRTRLGVPLLHQGVRTGLLWIQEGDQPWDRQRIVAQTLTLSRQITTLATLQYEMASPQLNDHRHLGDVFQDACRGDREAVAEMSRWPSLRRGRSKRVVVSLHDTPASVARPDDHRIAQLRIGFQQALANSGMVLVGFVRDTYTTTLVTVPPGASADAGLQLHLQLEAVCGRVTRGRATSSEQFPWTLHTGVSNPLTSVDDIATAYQQAVVAAQVAAVEPEIGPVSTWQNVGPYRFLAHNLRTKAPLRFEIHDLLTDNDPTGELAATLEVYYDQGDSVSRTAEWLHLHRTTLYYRLPRIKEIIGADPVSGFTRLELHMSFKAARWAQRPRV